MNSHRPGGRLRYHVVAVIAALAAALLLAMSGATAPARADSPNCETLPWPTLFNWGQQRQICDGPINGDGGWMRHRTIYTPAHRVPLTCNTYGSYSYASTSCSGGYFQPLTITEDDIYPVFPANVLGNEPGHLPL